MKEMPSTRDTSSGSMRETNQPSMKETTSSPAVTQEDTSPSIQTRRSTGPRDSGTTRSSDPLQACMDAISKGASPGQRSIAEQTCQRDFGMGDSRAVASGTQGDTQQNCLARIPKDASAGQRMLAEESCRRDEEVRRGF